MEKAMLFILTCKLAVATYAQAKQMADQCKLNKLLADPVMVGQLDMQGRPSFTFERLISPHHFAETPALQQAANYEWINEIAAVAMQKDNIDTHFFCRTSRLWTERPSSRVGRRGPLANALHRETAHATSFGGAADVPFMRPAGTPPVGRGTTPDSALPTRNRGMADMDPNDHDRAFRHRERVRTIEQQFRGKTATEIVNALLDVGGESVGRKLASYMVSMKDTVMDFQDPVRCLSAFRNSMNPNVASHVPAYDCLTSAITEVPKIAAALLCEADDPPPRFSLSGAGGSGSAPPRPRFGVGLDVPRSAGKRPAPPLPAESLDDSEDESMGPTPAHARTGSLGDAETRAHHDEIEQVSEDESAVLRPRQVNAAALRHREAPPFFTASMSRAHTQALPVRVGTVGAAMQGSDARRRAAITSIRASAMAHLTLSDGAMAIGQANSDFAQLRAANSLSSMYSEKRKGSRGRRLPGEQLPAARARVDGKLRAKALRPHGYGKRHSKQGESESDSDDNQTQGRISQSHRLAGGLLGAAERREAGERGEQAGGRAAGVHAAQSKCDAAATAKARGLTLPRGDAMRYQWEMPLTGAALTGRRVMCYFPNASGWFDGVVVQHLGSSGYSIFYEEDDEHEDWELPDPELVFMCNSEADHTVPVSRDMLPHV